MVVPQNFRFSLINSPFTLEINFYLYYITMTMTSKMLMHVSTYISIIVHHDLLLATYTYSNINREMHILSGNSFLSSLITLKKSPWSDAR